MLFAFIWVVGLSALSLGCVYHLLTHPAASDESGVQAPDDLSRSTDLGSGVGSSYGHD